MNFIPYMDHKTVLVTGFLPFKSGENGISINPSLEAVKLMDTSRLKDRLNITVIREAVPVEYEYIDANMHRMWGQYKPDLTIHVGVSNRVEEFTLEKQANRTTYIFPDNCDCVPYRHENRSYGPDCLATDLQVDRICETFNKGLNKLSLQAISSNEGGKFVCEYIYYTSLCEQLNRSKTSLLIHVPMMEAEKEFRELAEGLERLVEICVEQIRPKSQTPEMSTYYEYIL
ncbi:unnamed protein product [Arctia plantaginis]|uniref:Pyroglutamyl-peptidase I n=1 Tax=Arctia plantaginis TaxID=874455 RepID=A0A8S0YMZ9_ARCPL|nr:unnamed protein product [Arctia plantaginis]CAB3244371.1 unnamed protein product [Arctia plantaginis]